MKKFLGLFLAALLSAAPAGAALKLPALIGDHMVLQRGKPVVWGWADAGASVTVSMAGKRAVARAGRDGRWKAVLVLPKAGGPFDMTVSSGEAVTVHDVLVGEVWLNSGQSNMQFDMKSTDDAAKQVPAADYPEIRLFNVARTASLKPLDDVQGSWQVCTPDTVKDFSAVAYHFGRELHRALKTPVGLIESAWGGTGAEAWTPRPVLEKDPAFKQLVYQWDHDADQVKIWTQGEHIDLWLSNIRFIPKDPKDKPLTVLAQAASGGLGGSWFSSAAPGCQAAVTTEGKAFEGPGPAVLFTGSMKGGGWGTLTCNLTPSDKPLDLGRYKSVEFYAKGKGTFRASLGEPSITDYDYYATPDTFDAPDQWTKMSFDLSSFKQGGWGSPEPFTPGKIINLNFPVQVPYWPDLVAAAYDGMISPLIPYTFRGVLWYQGESNTDRADHYQRLLTDLIGGWRKAWGRRFPFLIIQLPNFMAVKPEPSESQWAELREAQRLTAKTVPDTALITTIDLGAADTIHPKDKTDVGRRAALAALARVYHRKGTGSGPLLQSVKVAGGRMLLTFVDTGRGLSTLDGKPVTGFALCGRDGDFHWARARITGCRTVAVSSKGVGKPVEVRYAWADNPVCNLSNREGLPAPPFRYSTLPHGASPVPPYFETWASLDASNAGTYTDSKGTTASFSTVDGPQKGQKALRLVFDLKSGGFCGLWHNLSCDLSKAKVIAFKAKTTLPGEVQVAFKDRWNVQYVAKADVSSADWKEIRIPVSSFIKDPYYTPDNAQLGHPMDLSRVNGMNFGPQAAGSGELWIGPVSGR